ncbi:RNA exonuclease 3 [Blastocladiella emersonii ATCC 22665]|nr:RNA exonuclease 3 [Blastocladiella emersonii ATCC 22665]
MNPPPYTSYDALSKLVVFDAKLGISPQKRVRTASLYAVHISPLLVAANYAAVDKLTPALAVTLEREIAEAHRGDEGFTNAAAKRLRVIKALPPPRAGMPEDRLIAYFGAPDVETAAALLEVEEEGEDGSSPVPLDGAQVITLDSSSDSGSSSPSGSSLTSLPGSGPASRSATSSLSSLPDAVALAPAVKRGSTLNPDLAAKRHKSALSARLRGPRSSRAIAYDAAFEWVMGDEDVILYGFPTYDTAHALIPRHEVLGREPGSKRKCDRCSKEYLVTAHPRAGECMYHHGRLRGVISGGERVREYTCCSARPNSASTGCTPGVHVWREERTNHLHAIEPFVVSPETCPGGPGKRLEMVALDCEMCYTTNGFELCRFTAVDVYGDLVMDELVKPAGEVLDLNSRFSGIQTLDGANKTLADVRRAFFHRIDQDTILVGHGLENDLKAMRIIHPTIADTVHIFKHPRGFPNRFALKYLMSKLLNVFIQNNASEGHDSFEDAYAALELLREKIKNPSLIAT